MARPVLLSAEPPRKIPPGLVYESRFKGVQKHVLLIFLLLFPSVFGWSQIPLLDFVHYHFYSKPTAQVRGEILREVPVHGVSAGNSKVFCYIYRYSVGDQELLGQAYLTLPKGADGTEGLQIGQEVDVAYNLDRPEKSSPNFTLGLKRAVASEQPQWSNLNSTTT